ncbi:MAG: M48 family metalloprotease [Treponema sp.]|nr:M48 family metalloprotease [Treponema sp.]
MMKRFNHLIIAAALISAVALASCTSEGFAFMGQLASAVGDDSTANAFNSMSKAAEEITPENEYYIGRSVAANLLTNYKLYEDKKLETYLNKICRTMVINSDDPELYNGYHVKILDSTEVNAFSTSGGHIFITRGLISCADSEDALAAVIAHEIGHIQLKHSLKSIKTSRYTEAVKATAGAAASAVGLGDMASTLDDMVGDVISDMVNNGYSQGQEYDADKKAIELMAGAGYSPDAMISMLKKMSEQQGTKKSGFYKTHPSPENRISHLNSTLKKTQVEDTTEFREDRYASAMKK